MKELEVYNEFRAQLSELHALNDSLTFNYADRKDNEKARSHIYKLRKTKTAVDKVRKAEKQESLDYGRRVDSEAKEIIGEIEEMIAVHQKPLDEIEQKEKERVEKHEDNIRELNEAAIYSMENWMEISMQPLIDRIGEIKQVPETEEYWEEYLSTAMKAKEKAIEDIQSVIEKREKYDAEQAELAALRAAQEEQARKDREREQKERDAKIAEEAAKIAQAAAEKRAQDEIEAERNAAALREKVLKEQAERAEREKQETEARLKREAEAEKAREAAEAKKREANKKHKASVNNAAVDALILGGMDKEQAKLAVTLIAKRMIPKLSISY